MEYKPEGINCQLATLKIYEELFGVSFPSEWMEDFSRNLYYDHNMFLFVGPTHGIRTGDVFFFGRKTSPPSKLHLAVYTGEVDGSGDILLAHSNEKDGFSTWPLQSFFSHRRYAKIHAVKRLKHL